MSNLLAVEIAEQMNNHFEEFGNLEAYEIDNFGGKGKARRQARKSKRKAKKTTKKTGRAKKIQNFKGKLKGAVNKLGKIGVLLPFKFAMIGALNNIGVKVTKKTDLTELSKLFYDKIVRKGKSKSNFETENFVLSASMVAGIVSGVLSFFKNLKKRKEAGEELNKSEEIALKKAEQVSEQVDTTTKDYTEEAIGETVMKYLPMALIGGVALYFIAKK